MALRNQNRREKEKLETSYKTQADVMLIAVAQVTADSGADIRIRIDEEGMRVVLESEKSRTPSGREIALIEDCSKKNCGYDVASFDRRIEVKSHRKSGSIMLRPRMADCAAVAGRILDLCGGGRL